MVLVGTLARRRRIDFLTRGSSKRSVTGLYRSHLKDLFLRMAMLAEILMVADMWEFPKMRRARRLREITDPTNTDSLHYATGGGVEHLTIRVVVKIMVRFGVLSIVRLKLQVSSSLPSAPSP